MEKNTCGFHATLSEKLRQDILYFLVEMIYKIQSGKCCSQEEHKRKKEKERK